MQRNCYRVALNCLLFTLIVTCGISVPEIMATESFDEDKLKVAFINNFLKFTTWPEAAFESPESELVLCSLGKDPLSGGLKALANRKVRDRVIRLLNLASPDEPEIRNTPCHVLFIPEDYPGQDGLITQLAGAPLLIVGEGNTFITKGGVIGLKLVGNKVKFDVNLRSAGNNKIVLSSLLLQLANQVYEG